MSNATPATPYSLTYFSDPLRDFASFEAACEFAKAFTGDRSGLQLANVDRANGGGRQGLTEEQFFIWLEVA